MQTLYYTDVKGNQFTIKIYFIIEKIFIDICASNKADNIIFSERNIKENHLLWRQAFISKAHIFPIELKEYVEKLIKLKVFI
jgi:hypothetical protein